MCMNPFGHRDRHDVVRGETDLGAPWLRYFASAPRGNVLMKGAIRKDVILADPDVACVARWLLRNRELAHADEFAYELDAQFRGLRGAGTASRHRTRCGNVQQWQAELIFTGCPRIISERRMPR